ncbi:hypothetical protein ACLOJK_020845 [Asimina triloba]
MGSCLENSDYRWLRSCNRRGISIVNNQVWVESIGNEIIATVLMTSPLLQARFSLALKRLASQDGVLYSDKFNQEQLSKLKAA